MRRLQSKEITFFFMRTDTTAPAGSLRGTDGYMPVDVRVTSLAGGRELLTGFFKDTGPQQLPDRPFRIVIHDGFYHSKLGVYTWQELNLQVRYTLRHDTGEINIVVPRGYVAAG